MKESLQKIIEQFVDFLLPTLTPYEAGLYIFLLRNSYMKNGMREIRIGKRTIADNLGASRGEKTNYAHVTKLVSGLEEKSCIKIGDTTRKGTLYSVFLPEENLTTSCLVCNSIKSGKTYEEAAPFLLKSIQERRGRNNNL